MVRLQEIAKPVQRLVPVEPGKSYRTLGVKWWGEGAYERQTIDGSQTAVSQLNEVRENDLIINKIWVRHGSVAVVTPEVAGCVGSNEFPTFEFRPERVLPRWLHWYSKTHELWAKCDALSQGSSGKNRIRPDKFLTIDVPLPPLEEQRRIVAKIDSLAAKIEEAQKISRLAATQCNALAGSLSNNAFLESALITPIAELADVRGGIQKGPHRAPGVNAVRYLTVAHVQRNRILTDNPRFFEVSPVELERWRLISGDVLIIEGNGSAEQIGRTALFRGEIDDCVHQNHVIRIRVDRNKVLPEYLNAFLNSPAGQEVVQGESRTTSGLRTLSVGRIKGIRIPVPQLSKQEEIVRSVDRSSSIANDFQKWRKASSDGLEALLPSILDRAFKGEL